MTEEESRRFEELYRANTDKEGKIVPSTEAMRRVEREHPDDPPAEKWRLAQARTLIDIHELATKRDVLHN